eukprot:1156598-Pelagomonas_calceolata.AAC.7
MFVPASESLQPSPAGLGRCADCVQKHGTLLHTSQYLTATFMPAAKSLQPSATGLGRCADRWRQCSRGFGDCERLWYVVFPDQPGGYNDAGNEIGMPLDDS